MTDFKPTSQFQRKTVQDLLPVLREIVKGNTGEDGWIDVEKVGKEVVWLVKSKRHVDMSNAIAYNESDNK